MSRRPPEWDARFPDREQLRAEVRCLAACVRDQLLARIARKEIRGVYLKGSSVKAWESPLDYVPEISDVDIHVWFRDDNKWRPHLDRVPQALAIQAGLEACFEERIPQPIHHPRLQLIVLNTLITGLEGFVHAPRSTVMVLHGEAYPEADHSDPEAIRRFDSADLVEKAAWVEQMPLHIIDKPGIYAREGLRQLVWRVGAGRPAGAAYLGPRHRACVELEPDPSHSGAARLGFRQPGRRVPRVLPSRLGLLPVRVHRHPRLPGGHPGCDARAEGGRRPWAAMA